jgi:hypothetical protein
VRLAARAIRQTQYNEQEREPLGHAVDSFKLRARTPKLTMHDRLIAISRLAYDIV